MNKKLGRLQTKVAGNWATYCTPTEKETGRQIVTCKLAYGIEPTNRADSAFFFFVLFFVFCFFVFFFRVCFGFALLPAVIG